MSALSGTIRVIDASLSEKRVGNRTLTVIRGVLLSNYFTTPFTPPYQRQEMDGVKRAELMEALAPNGHGVPDDITLGLRTTSFTTIGAGEFELTGPVAIIDGLQRLSAGIQLCAAGKGSQPLGVVVYIGIREDEEEKLFRQLNHKQTKVSSQVLLRGLSNPTIEALRKMATEDPEFPLYGKVQWDQYRQSGEVITAHMLYDVAAALHGAGGKLPLDRLVEKLQEVGARIGTDLVVENTKQFFILLEKLFPKEKDITFRYQLGFMKGLALFFSYYKNFWDRRSSNRLLVRAPDRNKLNTARIDEIRRYLQTGSQAAYNVRIGLVTHFNGAGRRKNLLVPRDYIPGT